eukprot:81123_1
MSIAIKYGLHKLPSSTISNFVAAFLVENDLMVKREMFLTMNAILRANSDLIIEGNILRVIYDATKTDESLIREVNLGPFIHRVDEGLPLRKASFVCLESLLECVAHKIDLFEFITYLKNGIVDECNDIQMLTYKMLYKIGKFHNTQILSVLDTLPNLLMKGIKSKMNFTRRGAKDVLRSACKALYVLRNIPNVRKATKFIAFYSRLEKTKILIPMLNEIEYQERKCN